MMEHEVELEARYADLAARLGAVERRLAAIEAGAPPVRARVPTRAANAEPGPRPATAAAARPGTGARAASTVPLVGRTLLVLAGAFVLRALTDAGSLPTSVGVALGLAYAGAWLALAERAGAAGAAQSAAFHGASAALVALPLIFEATTKFGLVGPGLASVLLGAFTAAALGVACRRPLEALGWIVALGGIAAATAIAVVTNRVAPSAAYLVALGVATLWSSEAVDWVGFPILPALAADAAVGAVALRVGVEGVPAAAVVLLGLVALHLGSIAARPLVLRREVRPFDVAQAALAVAVGLGGGVFVAGRAGAEPTGLGAAATALGLAAYAVAFAFAERPPRSRRNFAFHAWSGLALVIVGTALLLAPSALAATWAGLAVVAGVCARHPPVRASACPTVLVRLHRRPTLAAHAAVLAAAATVPSGVLPYAARATLGSPFVAWPRPPGVELVVLAAIAAVAWLLAAASARTRLQRAPGVVLLALLAVTLAGIAIGALAPWLGAPAPTVRHASEIATLRTVVLVAVAVALALVGRLERWADAAALAYPALGLIGLKILLEDLARGRPSTLLVAFACYGAALIAVARLRRGGVREVTGVAASPRPPVA